MSNGNTPIRPPELQYGDYTINGRSVSIEVKDGTVEIMTGIAWIDEGVRDEKTEFLSYLLRVVPVVGGPTTVRVVPKDMTAPKLMETLGNLGIIVHLPAHLPKFLMKTASEGEYAEKTPRTLIESPGWFADDRAFYTGNEAFFGRNVNPECYRLEPVTNSPFAERGTLAEWWENIGQHIEANFLLLAIACLFMVSPFLKLLGLGTRLICFWGGKGTGKTLGSQCAATIFGNGIDPTGGLFSDDLPYVTKFSSTKNGIELVLASRSPMPLALDEATEQSSDTMQELAYIIASGEGKKRMTSQLKADKGNRWLLTVVTTAEAPLADALSSKGKPVLGGMSDRAVDVAIDGSGMFQEFGAFGSFQALTCHLKKVCGEFYGTPGRALLSYAVENPKAVRARLDEAQDIEERLIPDGCGDGERRVVKLFAGAVAAGNVAIDAGVLKCEPDVIEAAFKRVTEIWWHSRGGALHRIAQFLLDNEAKVRFSEPSLNSAKAFVTDTLVIIPDYEFTNAFGSDAKKMVSELKGLNALVREQDGRNKHRFCNNSLFAYVIQLARIKPIFEHMNAIQSTSQSEDGDENTAFEELLD